MSAPEDVEALLADLLAEHHAWEDSEYDLHCRCGALFHSPDEHRAHVAAVLAAYVVEKQREAWAECVQEAEDCGWMHDLAADDMAARNPYATTTYPTPKETP